MTAARKAARVTPFSPGDCVKHIPNQFELVLIATKRFRELNKGATPHVNSNGDHNMTVAMREIASGHIGREYLFKKDKK